MTYLDGLEVVHLHIRRLLDRFSFPTTFICLSFMLLLVFSRQRVCVKEIFVKLQASRRMSSTIYQWDDRQKKKHT